MGSLWAQQSYAIRRSPLFLMHTKNAISSNILFFPISSYGAIRGFPCSCFQRVGRSYVSSSPLPSTSIAAAPLPSTSIAAAPSPSTSLSSYFSTSSKPRENWKPTRSIIHGMLPDPKSGDKKRSTLRNKEGTLQSSISLAQKDGMNSTSMSTCDTIQASSKTCKDIDAEVKGSSFSLQRNVQDRGKNGRKKKLKVSDNGEHGLVNSAKFDGDGHDEVDGSSFPLLQNIQLVSKLGRIKKPTLKVSKDSNQDLVGSLGVADDGFKTSKPLVKSDQLVSDGPRRASRPKVCQKEIEDIVNSSLKIDAECNLGTSKPLVKSAQLVSDDPRRAPRPKVCQKDEDTLNSSLKIDSECNVEMLQYAEWKSKGKQKTSQAKKAVIPDDLNSFQKEKDGVKDSSLLMLESTLLAKTNAKKRHRVKVKGHDDQGPIDSSMPTHYEMNVSGLISFPKDQSLSSGAGKTTCDEIRRKGSTDFSKANENEEPKFFTESFLKGPQSVIEIAKDKIKFEVNLKKEKAELMLISTETNDITRSKVLELEKDNEGNYEKSQIHNNHNGIVVDSNQKDNDDSSGMSDPREKTYETEEKPCDIRGISNVKVSRRFKKNPEEMVSLLRLHTCSKYGDLHGALDLYDEVKNGGIIKLNVNFYSSLLYICSGAASGTLTRSKSGRERKREGTISKETGDSMGMISRESVENSIELISFNPEDMELAARRGTEIYEHMLEVQAPFNEAIFTSLSRLAVAKGDGDLAFDIVKKMALQGIAPKLRSYGPALHCFCENNEIHKAFEVDKHMEEAGVLPDENILDNLLKVSIKAGEEEKVYSLLHRLRKRVRDLSSITVATIESWFTSENASSIGESRNKNLSIEKIKKAIEANGGGWHGLGWMGKGKWDVKRTNLSKNGLCLSCGEKLCTIDLDPIETTQFAETIARFACEREHLPNQFKEFQHWLDRNGPYGAILDGANIGLYNPQVFRGFSFKLLSSVMNKAGAKISNEKPSLILLHNRHSTRIAQSVSDEATINRWKKEKALYFTPQGSNDDWYWLYAAVKCKCLLVTNDEMRDHIFELLGTEFFPKWKERHQVRFTFSPKGLELHMPPPYSIIIQESQNGSWHIPEMGGNDIDVPREWLCVTRATC